MYLARSSPTVLTWFMDASLSGLQRPHSGTPRPPGASTPSQPLTALAAFDHLGVRFVSVQDQIDTDSPMGRAMFTIIGVMAELESSLISERVTAGMRAAEA